PLLARALLPAEFALPGPELPQAALGIWFSTAAPPDEARSIAGAELSVREILSATVQLPTAAPDLMPLIGAATGEIDTLFGEALARGGPARRAALEALDARNDGPGLGALVPADAPLTAGAAAALHEVAWPLADRIAAALDDPDRRTRA